MHSKDWFTAKSLLIVCCLSLAIACTRRSSLPSAIIRACPSPSPVSSKDGKLKLFIPDDPQGWFKLVLGETSKQAAKAGLPDLKTVVLAGSDLEMRFWLGSIDGYRGIIFKRSGSHWTATQLEYVDFQGVLKPIRPYPEPEMGWDEFWKKLLNQGILELPDGDCFKDRNIVLDGATFFIEVNLQGTYRIYHYSNPQFQTADRDVRDPQALEAAKRMSNIAGLILDMSQPGRINK